MSFVVVNNLQGISESLFNPIRQTDRIKFQFEILLSSLPTMKNTGRYNRWNVGRKTTKMRITVLIMWQLFVLEIYCPLSRAENTLNLQQRSNPYPRGVLCMTLNYIGEAGSSGECEVTSSFPWLPDPLWFRVVVSVRIPSTS